MSGSVSTRVTPVRLVPEIRLLLADESVDLWQATGGAYRSDQPPPFWAFAWAGGQGLARYLLDHPEVVAGRRVLDLAAGSGIVAVAAALSGAARVRAVDVDPAAVAAIRANADSNGVTVYAEAADLLDGPVPGPGDADPAAVDVLLAGDACYSGPLADRMLRFLRRAARSGIRVLIGDADRGFLPGAHVRTLAGYDVPVPVALEGVRQRHVRIAELVPPAAA